MAPWYIETEKTKKILFLRFLSFGGWQPQNFSYPLKVRKIV